MAEIRKCIGSSRFGIEPHDAPIEDFPAQPSQKDGIGRMCKTHWNQYTAGLARDAKARKAHADGQPADLPEAIVDPSPKTVAKPKRGAPRQGATAATPGEAAH